MSDDDEPISQVPDAELARALVGMLHDARKNGGQIDPDTFWQFVSLLTHGRGITEGLDRVGLDLVEAVDKQGKRPPANKRADEQMRAYHRGIVGQLLSDMSSNNGKRLSIFPERFHALEVARDLAAMGPNPYGLALGEPRILCQKGGRRGFDRDTARHMVISYVCWKAAREGISRAKVRDSLPCEVPKRTWEGWIRDAKDTPQRAKKAGEGGKPTPPIWPPDAPSPDDTAALDAFLGEVLTVARQAQGVNKSREP